MRCGYIKAGERAFRVLVQKTSIMEDLLFAAKYPFSRRARDILSEYALTDDYDTLEKAYEQTVYWLNEQDYYSELKGMENASPSELEFKVVCFPLAKIMAGVAGRHVLSRLGKAFAKRTEVFLVNSGEDSSSLMKELFGDTEKVHVKDFLENRPPGIKLAETGLDRGWVPVNRELGIKLVSRAVYNSILSTRTPKGLGKNILFFAGELAKETFPEEQVTGPVSFPSFPPCIRKIISDLESGEKVGHAPRFVLATFLANIGMSKEEIVKFYEKQPNFDRKKTLYHVSSVFKGQGSAKYSVPSCRTLESYGLCVRDSTCKWSHPLTYYKRRRRKLS